MQNEDLNLLKQNIKLRQEVTTLKKELKRTSDALSFANNKVKQLERKFENYKKDEEKRIEDIVNKAVTKVTDELNKKHKKETDELNAKISRLEKRLNTNSSNSGLPTSKDPIGKKKIQNNREKSNKSIGAQEGHKINKLEYFKDEEITNVIEHTFDACPKCGGKLEETNVVISDIIDINVEVTKTRNNIHNYNCPKCKMKITGNLELPRGVTYGKNINATCLSLMNESNTALNKITSFLSGITNGEIKLTEGYLIKLQKRSADKLEDFKHNLSEKIITLKNVFWDDTTVNFGIGKPEEGYDKKDLEYLEKENNKKHRQGIIRFYGDDLWALIIGHRNKDEKGIDADGILENLSEDCVVMHDHVLLNYNEKYSYKNAECNEHTLRYLKRNMDMFPNHEWSSQMRSLLKETNEEKNEHILKKKDSFPENKIKNICNKYSDIISLGYKENETVDLTYIKDKTDELNLLERLDKYKENHLMFAKDFKIAFTNNTSERGLRQVKRKIAVSFMFKNANRMKDYATILSYLETCYRHGISRYEASKRLVGGNPFSIKELQEISNSQKNEKV